MRYAAVCGHAGALVTLLLKQTAWLVNIMRWVVQSCGLYDVLIHFAKCNAMAVKLQSLARVCAATVSKSICKTGGYTCAAVLFCTGDLALPFLNKHLLTQLLYTFASMCGESTEKVQ